MTPDDQLFDDLAEAVLDGDAIDWAAAESSGDATGHLIRQLKIVAAVAEAHRQSAVSSHDHPATASTTTPLESWGHLRICERIGRGAFGEVYRAWDTRLDREVALKLMPVSESSGSSTSLTIDEGRLLARVRHSNVVTIHGADQIGAHVGLWMEFVHGRTLEELLHDGHTFKAAEVARIGLELVKALGAVHSAGLLHRDIKAQNVMRSDDGRIVLMDFGTGCELHDEAAALTGTPLYLAPEIFQGQPATPQSDIYSLGVLLYHLLTNSYPVHGKTMGELRLAHERNVRFDLRAFAPEVPAGLTRVIERAINARPAERYATAKALGADLEKCLKPSPHRGWLQRVALVAVGLAMAVGLAAVAWPVLDIGSQSTGHSRQPDASAPKNAEQSKPNSPVDPSGEVPPDASKVARATEPAGLSPDANNRTWAREVAIPAILKLVEADEYLEAYRLAVKAEAYIPGDPVLARLWPQISATTSPAAAPEGVDVYYKPYDQQDGWTHLGTTPLTDILVPRALLQFRFVKASYDPADLVIDFRAGRGVTPTRQLRAAGEAMNMSRVPGGDRFVNSLFPLSRESSTGVPPYEIGRHEVTNKEYGTFVKAGGYGMEEYWRHPFIKERRPLSFSDAMREFRDGTGLPGPSTWRGGTYPDGEDDYPVTGISWFEAAAFAEFAGKRLPTVAHWTRAAGTPFPASITRRSNFSNKGLRPVGTGEAMSPFGSLDMAGNAREWVWNETPDGEKRYALGGAWNEPSYVFTSAQTLSPFDRSPENGFRVAQYGEDDAVRPFLRPVLIQSRDVSQERPVSDELFRAFARQFDYDDAPLDPQFENAGLRAGGGWEVKIVTISSPGGGERIKAYLYLPTRVDPPYQTIVFFPGANAAAGGSSEDLRQGPGSLVLDSLILSGRAFLFPIYHGTFERSDRTPHPVERTARYKDWTIRQIKEVKRWVDFMSSQRTLFDPKRLAYLGLSWGAAGRAPLVLAVEPRLKTGILYSGGFAPEGFPAEVDPLNFISRVSVPVLMLNGSEDFIFSVKRGQEPFFGALGTPAGQKRHVVLTGGHQIWLAYPQTVARETIDWLDWWFGRVR